jgi:hypothetical protein
MISPPVAACRASRSHSVCAAVSFLPPCRAISTVIVAPRPSHTASTIARRISR